jgi:hypothetical protein
MKINIGHHFISLDEIGYSVGMALMVLGLFVGAGLVMVGIAVVVLSMFLPDFIVFEFGTPEDEG